ncbi:MAG: CpsD/CapB family tyrosine-protein kinase [Marinobacter sp.]
MERIKAALVKAQRIPSADVGRIVQAKASPPALLQYDYTQTRGVKLDHSLMNRNRIVCINKDSPHSVAFDILRTKILRKMDENGWRTLAITSPTPGSGKTVVALNLAMSISYQMDRSALLVDLDLRRPKVAAYLGLSSGKSLNDVYRGGAEISEAMVNPGMPRLVILPSYEPEARPAEILSSARTKDMIKELGQRYMDRVVIFDLPPLLSADDAMTVLPQVDCMLLVIGDGEVSESEIEESLGDLPALNIVGVVLNKAEVVNRGYY